MSEAVGTLIQPDIRFPFARNVTKPSKLVVTVMFPGVRYEFINPPEVPSVSSVGEA